MAKNKKERERSSAMSMIVKYLGSLAFLMAAFAIVPKVTEKIANLLYKWSLHWSNRKYEKDWEESTKGSNY